MGYCVWAGMNEANRTYHNTEWGIVSYRFCLCRDHCTAPEM